MEDLYRGPSNTIKVLVTTKGLYKGLSSTMVNLCKGPSSTMEDLCRVPNKTMNVLVVPWWTQGGSSSMCKTMEHLYRGSINTMEVLVLPWRTFVRCMEDLAVLRRAIGPQH